MSYKLVRRLAWLLGNLALAVAIVVLVAAVAHASGVSSRWSSRIGLLTYFVVGLAAADRLKLR